VDEKNRLPVEGKFDGTTDVEEVPTIRTGV